MSIKVTVKFENKDKDAEDTIVSAYFEEFEKISEWLDKIKDLNEEKKLKHPMGFLTEYKKENANVSSDT